MPSNTSDKDNNENYPWGRSKHFTVLIRPLGGEKKCGSRVSCKTLLVKDAAKRSYNGIYKLNTNKKGKRIYKKQKSKNKIT